MSNTFKPTFKHLRINDRGNPYGLCRCAMCRRGKYSMRWAVHKIQKKLRKDPYAAVGLYTD